MLDPVRKAFGVNLRPFLPFLWSRKVITTSVKPKLDGTVPLVQCTTKRQLNWMGIQKILKSGCSIVIFAVLNCDLCSSSGYLKQSQFVHSSTTAPWMSDRLDSSTESSNKQDKI